MLQFYATQHDPLFRPSKLWHHRATNDVESSGIYTIGNRIHKELQQTLGHLLSNEWKWIDYVPMLWPCDKSIQWKHCVPLLCVMQGLEMGVNMMRDCKIEEFQNDKDNKNRVKTNTFYYTNWCVAKLFEFVIYYIVCLYIQYTYSELVSLTQFIRALTDKELAEEVIEEICRNCDKIHRT